MATLIKPLVIAAVILSVFLALPCQMRGFAQPTSLLGTGRGLDHVITIVRDLEEAARVYTDVLGFTVVRGGSFPGGLRNSAVMFRMNYLELMSVDSTQARPDDELVRFLKKREGGYAFALNVSSAQQTADFLRARNVEVTAPEGSSFIPEGSKEVQKALWRTVSITKPSFAYQPLFFIEYAPPENFAPSARSENGAARAWRQPPEHRNTAVEMHSVWIAVKDLEEATKGYEAIGLRSGRKLRMPQLSAEGRELSAGQGAILLLKSNESKGPLAPFVAQHGEGVVGMSIEVRDLQAARTLLQSSIRQQHNLYKGVFGKSILLAPEFTHGVWIELFQKPGI